MRLLSDIITQLYGEGQFCKLLVLDIFVTRSL